MSLDWTLIVWVTVGVSIRIPRLMAWPGEWMLLLIMLWLMNAAVNGATAISQNQSNVAANTNIICFSVSICHCYLLLISFSMSLFLRFFN